MKEKINILGINVSRSTWRKLCQTIQNRLSRDGIEFEFQLFSLPRGSDIEELAGKTQELQPDILFVSLVEFESLERAELFLKRVSNASGPSVPTVICVDKTIKKVLEDLLIPDPSVSFEFLEYGNLAIRDVKMLLSLEGEIPAKIPIQPMPEILGYEGKAPYLDDAQQVSFYRLDHVNKVMWKGQAMTVDTLKTEIASNADATTLSAMLFFNNEAYFINGFHIFQLFGIKIGIVRLDQIVDTKDIGGNGVNFELLIRRINEKLKEKICDSLRYDMSYNQAYIKKNLAFTVGTEFPVIGQILKQIMRFNAFAHVKVEGEDMDSNQRFWIQLGKNEDEVGPEIGYEIPLKESLFNIPGFPQVDPSLSATRITDDQKTPPSRIQNERKQILRKLDDLEGQIKNLSSSKVLADQEKYMNLLASRKLEIISVLLELASIWDDLKEEIVKTYEEDVLILHEDQIEATYLNKRVIGEGKRLFLDITENFMDMRRFVSLNTDLYESFLHEGIIICSPSCRASIQKKLDEFQLALDNKKYPDVVAGLNKLKHRKQKYQTRLVKLAYEEAVCEVRDVYSNVEDALLAAAVNELIRIEKEQLIANTLSEICFFASNETSAKNLKDSFTNLFPLSGGTRLHTLTEYLPIGPESATKKSLPTKPDIGDTLDTDDASTIEVARYTDFIQKSVRQLKEISSDLLIIDHNLYVIQSLVNVLRNDHSAYAHTPIIALFSNDFDEDVVSSLILNGVKLFYVNKWRVGNRDVIQSCFKQILNEKRI